MQQRRRGAGGQVQMGEDALDHRRIDDAAMIFSSPPQLKQGLRSMAKSRVSSRAEDRKRERVMREREREKR